MRKIFILSISFLLSACTLVLETPSPTASPTALQPTASPTEAASPTPTLTPTATFAPDDPPVESENLISNPLFEGEISPHTFPEWRVYPDWIPYQVEDLPYPLCIEGQESGCNDPDIIKFQQAEYKQQEFFSSVINGVIMPYETGQQWFLTYGYGQTGIYTQVHNVPVGKQCLAGGRITTRSAAYWDERNDPYPDPTVNPGYYESTLDMSKPDDSIANQWTIRVDTNGGIDPNQAEVISPVSYGDFTMQIKELEFVAQSSTVTLFFDNYRTWALQHQDNIVHDAYLVCWVSGEPEPTPTQIAGSPTLTPEPTLEPTAAPTEPVGELAGYLQLDPPLRVQVYSSLKLRSSPVVGINLLTTVFAGESMLATHKWLGETDSIWLYVDRVSGYDGWIAAVYQGVAYAYYE